VIKDGAGNAQVTGLTVGTDADADINLPDMWATGTVTIHDGSITHG